MKTTLTIVVMMASMAVQASVDGELYYSGGAGISTATFTRTLDAALGTNNAAMGIIDTGGDGFNPPWTNAARRWVDENDSTNCNASQPVISTIGWNGAAYSVIYSRYGRVQFILSCSGLVNLNGMIRFFSSGSVTGSAYYGEGGSMVLKSLPDNQATVLTNQYVCNIINPAYKMFFTCNPTNVPAFPVLVTGAVYATTAGGSNQLSTGVIQVDWRHDGSMVWSQGTAMLGANGEFMFAPAVAGYPTGVWVRVRVKDANCQAGRTNLPATTSYLGTGGSDTINGYGPILLVPEPALLGIAVIIGVAGMRKRWRS